MDEERQSKPGHSATFSTFVFCDCDYNDGVNGDGGDVYVYEDLLSHSLQSDFLLRRRPANDSKCSESEYCGKGFQKLEPLI